MVRAKSVDEYIDLCPDWAAKKLVEIRSVLRETDLAETIKWGGPAYVGQSNVIGLGAFKHFVSVWFHQGSFLRDVAGVLIAAQDETRGLRQWRFEPEENIDLELLKTYIMEAIENDRKGRKIRPEKKSSAVPQRLKEALSGDDQLKMRFEELTPAQQREYAAYIGEAKREATQTRRLDKSIKMIKSGKGLNDKYRS